MLIFLTKRSAIRVRIVIYLIDFVKQGHKAVGEMDVFYHYVLGKVKVYMGEIPYSLYAP